MTDPTYLRIQPDKTTEYGAKAQLAFVSSILTLGKRSLLDQILFRPMLSISLELVSTEQKTHFFLVTPHEHAHYFSSQLLSQYPTAHVSYQSIDPLAPILEDQDAVFTRMNLIRSYTFPLNTLDGADTAGIAAILGFFAKLNPDEQACVQILIRAVDSQRYLNRVRSSLKRMDAEGKEVSDEYAAIKQKKLANPIVEVLIRLGASGPQALARLKGLSGSFGVFTLPEGNSLVMWGGIQPTRNSLTQRIAKRTVGFFDGSIKLNLAELAALWQLPDERLKNITLIDWGKTVVAEAPDSLAVSQLFIDEEQKRSVNFFAKTQWRNQEAIFGLKHEDRRRHTYIIGKTGSGKSTLIANMAINDIRNGHGVGVIDPHGDLTEMILHYIPKRRVNDVIYLDPTLNSNKAFTLNLFDAEASAHTDVVASGIVSVFYKLYHHSWGPRLEYILRNTILTLLYYQNATFADIPRLLTDKKFRSTVIHAISKIDPILTAFWVDEFEAMNDKFRVEAISPILNKVGQFLSSQRIRHIVQAGSSSFSLHEVMNEGKIILVNLSQGKLGEDTTALLGAMLITKMQLTAMSRVHMPEEQRRDFYLYVDEFQNFATTSFIKILSEARKYRLNLVMANQYIGQVDEDIQSAVFGNVGTLISFVIGAHDASKIEKEFGGVFEVADLVGLGKFEVYMKMAIDGITSLPFGAHTLALPSVINDNAEKILRVSSERYYKPFK